MHHSSWKFFLLLFTHCSHTYKLWTKIFFADDHFAAIIKNIIFIQVKIISTHEKNIFIRNKTLMSSLAVTNKIFYKKISYEFNSLSAILFFFFCRSVLETFHFLDFCIFLMILENSQKNWKIVNPQKRRKNCNKIFSKNLLKKKYFL